VHNCGFQGSVGALVRMGALDDGSLTEDDLPGIIAAWRLANQKIAGRSYKGESPGFWEILEEAALRCVRTRRPQALPRGMEFSIEYNVLFLRLPAGRRLAYPQPKIQAGEKFGNDVVSFMGLSQETNQWSRQETFGGRLAENVTQAASRDVLAAKLLRIDALPAYRGRLRAHVHDEGVWSLPPGVGSVVELEELFAEPLDWAPGLPLAGDGFEAPFYQKTE
jgi:DNA polymerase